MKILLSAIMIMALALPAVAQEQTLLGGEITHGGYGGPDVKFTQIDGKFAVLAGGRGGWIVNHSFVLGGAAYGLAQENIDRHTIAPSRTQFLTMGYGGFLMEYDIHPQRLLHASIVMLVGGGEINHAVRGQDFYESDDALADGFFVFEPELNFTLNMTSFMRISTGASYRFVSGVESYGMTDKDIAGPAASLMVRFGKF